MYSFVKQIDGCFGSHVLHPRRNLQHASDEEGKKREKDPKIPQISLHFSAPTIKHFALVPLLIWKQPL